MFVMPSALPDSARRKFASLRTVAAEVSALQPNFVQILRNQENRANAIRGIMRGLTRDGLAPSDNNVVEKNAAELASLQRDLADVETEMNNLRERARKKSADGQSSVDVFNAVETWISRKVSWLESKPGWGFKEVKTEVSKRDQKAPAAALGRVREEIVTAKRILARARGAMPPRSEIKEAARNFVTENARKHQIFIGRMGAATSPAQIKPVHFNLFDPSPSELVTRSPTSATLAAFACWLQPERMIAKLEAEIDERFNDRNAVSVAERTRLEAETPGIVLGLERMEEALIEHLLNLGESVTRRSDADPRAVLGIEVAKPSTVAKLVGELTGNKADLDHPELAEDEAA